jgi:putative ABC transport system permease protein
VVALWPLIRQSLRRRPLRIVITATAVVLGTAALLSSQIVLSRLLTNAQQSALTRAGASDLDVRVGSGLDLTPAQITALQAIPGVSQAAPLYEKRVNALPSVTGTSGPVVSVVAVHNKTVALRQVSLAGGRLPADGSRNEVAVDVAVAHALTPGVKTPIGSNIALQTATGPDEFRVVGLVADIGGGPGFVTSPVIVSETAIHSAFALNIRAPLVALALRSGTSTDQVAAAVRHLLGARAVAVDPRDSGVVGLAQVDTLVDFVAALAVLLGAVVVANSVAFSANERRSDLALLRAAGASSAMVARLLVTEVAIIAVPAAVAGAGCGLLLGELFSRLAAGSVPPSPQPVSVLALLLAPAVGVVAAVGGAFVPAITAARANIMEGLRPVVSERHSPRNNIVVLMAPAAAALAILAFAQGGTLTVAFGTALLLGAAVAILPLIAPPAIRLVALPLALFSADARQAAANLIKRRQRTSLTQVGLVVSTAVTVAIAAVSTSALQSSDEWVGQLFVGNTLIKSPVTEPDSLVAAFATSKQAGDVSAVRIMSVPVDEQTVGVAVIDPLQYQRGGGLEVSTPSRQTAFKALTQKGNVLVPALLAGSNGWGVGTKLSAVSANQTVTLTVAGVVDHGFPAGEDRETLIMGRDAAVAAFGNQAQGFDDLELNASDPSAAESEALRYGLSATPITTIQDAARQAVDRPLGLLQSLTAIAVVIAMLATINTLLLNIRAGVRELALLRAVGLSKRRARSLMLCEASLLSISGILIGVCVGALVAVPLLSVGSTLTFTLDYQFPVLTALGLVVVVVWLTLLISTRPSRRAAAQSIVSALRQE